MLLREFLVKDLEKGSSDVGGYISAVWGVVPNYFSPSILPSRACRLGRGLG